MEFNIAVGNTSVVNAGDFLGIALYDASAPGVVVQYQELVPPYGGTYTLTFPGLSPIVYNAILWENSTASPGGTIQCQFSLQPTQSTVQVRADLFLIADSSTGFTSTSPTYTDSSLSGWTYRIIASETQTLQPGVDYTTSDTSFTLNSAPNSGDTYVLEFQPIVATTSAVVTTNNLYAGYSILTANTTIDNTYAGQFTMLQGASSAFTITLPSLSTVGLFQLYTFSSDGGSHVNVTIQCAGSDTIQYGGRTVSLVTLGQGERLSIFKTGAGYWSVQDISMTVNTVGEIFYSYKTTELNCIFMNGATLSRTSYARLWAWIQTLPSYLLVNDTTWGTSTIVNGNTYFLNQGLFSTGDGSTTFRLPSSYSNSFYRMVDSLTRLAGTGAVETIKSHNHTMHGAGSITDTGGPYFVGKTGSVYDYSKAGSTSTLLGGVRAPDTTMRTGGDNGVSGSSPAETVPTNTGCYAMIRF